MPKMSKETVSALIELGGADATPQEIEATTKLYNTLAEQLEEVSSDALEEVEPHFIQPTRRGRSRS